MQDTSTAYCELDLVSASINIETPLVFKGDTCLVRVKLLNLWSNSSPADKTITLSIKVQNKRTCYLESEGVIISLVANEMGDLDRFLEIYFDKLIDIALTRVLFQEAEDILLIEPSAAGKVWVFSLLQQPENNWQGRLIERNRPEHIDVAYSISLDTGYQRQDIDETFKQFELWLSNDFSWIGDSPQAQQKLLVIKVNPDELWFLRFPLSVFCLLQYGGFAAYRAVEWIVTSKSFMQNCSERLQMHEELSDVQRLLERSVVIINTDSEHESNPLYQEGTGVVIEILSYLKEIEFPTATVSLRWYQNPSANEIKQLLLDKRVSYFFADFEASNGQWELGDGQRQSWIDSISCPLPMPLTTSGREPFPLEGNDFNLSHIRLMRVFHCNSIFNPWKASEDRREPADNHSIVRRLLAAGAQRVEGGMTYEGYFDYLCSMIDLFCKSEHLGFILECKCLELGIDFEDLIGRANKFLEACGRETIPV